MEDLDLNMDTINAVQSAPSKDFGPKGSQPARNRQVYANETLGVNSSSDEDDVYRAIGRGINQRNN